MSLYGLLPFHRRSSESPGGRAKKGGAGEREKVEEGDECKLLLHFLTLFFFFSSSSILLSLLQVLGGEGVVVKDEGVQDSEGNVYGLEDGRRDGEQEGSQEAMAGFGQVSSSSSNMFFNIQSD